MSNFFKNIDSSMNKTLSTFILCLLVLGLLFCGIFYQTKNQISNINAQQSQEKFHLQEAKLKKEIFLGMERLTHDSVMLAALDQSQFHGIKSLLSTQLDKHNMLELYILNAKCDLLSFKSVLKFDLKKTLNYCLNGQLPEFNKIVRNDLGQYYASVGIKDSKGQAYKIVAMSKVENFKIENMSENLLNTSQLYQKIISNNLLYLVILSLMFCVFISFLVFRSIERIRSKDSESNALFSIAKLIVSGKDSRKVESLLRHQNADIKFQSKIKDFQDFYLSKNRSLLSLESELKKSFELESQQSDKINRMGTCIADLMVYESKHKFATDIMNQVFSDVKGILYLLEDKQKSNLFEISENSNFIGNLFQSWQDGVEERGARKYLRGLSETTLPGGNKNILSQNISDIIESKNNIVNAKKNILESQITLNQNFTKFYQDLSHWIGYNQKISKTSVDNLLLILQANKRYSKIKFKNFITDLNQYKTNNIFNKVFPSISSSIYDVIYQSGIESSIVSTSVEVKDKFVEVVYSLDQEIEFEYCMNLKSTLRELFSYFKGFQFFHSPKSFFPLVVRYFHSQPVQSIDNEFNENDSNHKIKPNIVDPVLDLQS